MHNSINMIILPFVEGNETITKLKKYLNTFSNIQIVFSFPCFESEFNVT